jgi:hypothetical protein
VFESIATTSAHRPHAERRDLYREALRAAHDEFASPASTRPRCSRECGAGSSSWGVEASCARPRRKRPPPPHPQQKVTRESPRRQHTPGR